MGEQLDLFVAPPPEPNDYRWQVQCVHHVVDERTGEPFRWVIGCWSEENARETAARIEREHPGVTAKAVRR